MIQVFNISIYSVSPCIQCLYVFNMSTYSISSCIQYLHIFNISIYSISPYTFKISPCTCILTSIVNFHQVILQQDNKYKEIQYRHCEITDAIFTMINTVNTDNRRHIQGLQQHEGMITSISRTTGNESNQILLNCEYINLSTEHR